MKTIPRSSSVCLIALLSCPAPGLCQTAQSKGPSASKVDRAGDLLPQGAIARLGTTRFRHPGTVQFVGYFGRGGFVVTASGASGTHLWDARTGKEVRRLEARTAARRVLLSGDGSTLLLVSDDGDCTVIDVDGGKRVRQFKTQGASQSLLSGDGRLLVAVHNLANNNPISIWDASCGMLLRTLTPRNKENTFVAAALSRDGTTLAAVEKSGAEDKAQKKGRDKQHLIFWDAATGKELRSVPASLDTVTDLEIVGDGKTVLLHDSQRQEIRLVDAATGKEVRKFAAKQPPLRGMLLSHDHKSLFVLGYKHVTQYDLATGKELRDFAMPALDTNEHSGTSARLDRLAVALSPDGKTLAVPAHAAVVFYDVASGKEIEIADGHRDRIDSLVFGADDNQVLTGSSDGGLYLWDAAHGRRLRQFVRKEASADQNSRGEHMRSLFRVRGTFSPDYKTVTALWWRDKLHVFDAASGKLRFQLGGDQGHTAFALSPDGRSVALAGPEGALQVWDMARAKRPRTFGTLAKTDPDGRIEESICSTAFSPDSRMLLGADFTVENPSLKVQVKYWELASGRERRRFQNVMDVGGRVDFDAITSALDSFLVSFVFAPDGKTIAEAGFSNIKLRDLKSGREVRVFGGRQVAGATTLFSPDGKLLVAGKHDGAIRLWDLATATVLLDFPAHQGGITALAFSPSRKLLASGGKEGSVLLWDWDYIRAQAGLAKPAAAVGNHERLWTDLAGADAARAYEAIKLLAATPAATVAFLKGRLRPVPVPAPGRLAKLLADLDDRQFSVRLKAEQALEKLGDLAAHAINDRLAHSPSLETTRRLQKLAKKLDAQETTAEMLQTLRALEVLEMIGTTEVRQVLASIAEGAAGHRVTEEAKRSLRRLAKK
jgi:WD40 repeat protein